jgi:hypothetical protein
VSGPFIGRNARLLAREAARGRRRHGARPSVRLVQGDVVDALQPPVCSIDDDAVLVVMTHTPRSSSTTTFNSCRALSTRSAPSEHRMDLARPADAPRPPRVDTASTALPSRASWRRSTSARACQEARTDPVSRAVGIKRYVGHALDCRSRRRPPRVDPATRRILGEPRSACGAGLLCCDSEGSPRI